MNELDMERRLNEAFDAKAEQLVPSRTTPPPLDLGRPAGSVTPLHRHRRVWIGTGLLAAAAAVVAVALVAVSGDDVASRPAPVAPAEQTTPPAPAASASPTASATASAATSASAGATAAAGTHTVTVDGVSLQVPTAWSFAPATAGSPFRCLSVGGAAPTKGGPTDEGCELSVAVQGQQTLGDMNPDTLTAFGDVGQCDLTTVTADEVTIDGQTAEHRVFTGGCLYGIEEQWTVLTTPTVVFAHDVEGPGTDASRAAQAAVVGAGLPGPRSAVRVADTGIPEAATTSRLTLDRVTYYQGRSPHVVDVNPATYDYTLTPATSVVGANGPISLDRFVTMVGSGDWSGAGVDGAVIVFVHTDGSTVTSIDIGKST